MANSTPFNSRLHLALQATLYLLITLTAIGYPVCLPESILNSMGSWFSGKTYSTQILPWLSCGLTPLILKESLLITLSAGLLFVFTWIKIRNQWLGNEQAAIPLNSGIRFWLSKPEAWAIALMVYMAASVAWSPVFQLSLQTWVLFAAGITVAIICRSEICGPAVATRFMVLTVLCGVAIGGFAVLQHLEMAPLLPKSQDPRNRMSSLIGHNTGMSSWLMFPLSFTIYFALCHRKVWVKIVNLIFATLFILVIVAAQSRAIWVLALLILIVLPTIISRLRHIAIRIPVIMAVLLMALGITALLSVSPKNNPFARLPVTLEERVTGDILNSDQLRRETRIRILAISLRELFPKSPVFGTGIGSFSWEYPKAQGDYFNKYPDSRLGTTTRRTDVAHNDYLQILIEGGVIGFLLLSGCIVTFWRDSRYNYRHLKSSVQQTQWWALIIPTTAVALHGFVDFPFHVVPIALMAVTSAALSSRLSKHPTLTKSLLNDPQEFARATWIALACTVILFSWLPWGWSALSGRILVSDVYYQMGQRLLFANQATSAQALDRRMILLDQSRRAFREAVITNVFNGEAYEGQATAYVNKSSYALHAYKQMRTEELTSTTQLQAIEMLIDNDARAALSVLENQIHSGELRYHYTYYLMGKAWANLWELQKITIPESTDQNKFDEAVAAYNMALAFNPFDAMSLRDLSDLLNLVPGREKESAELLQRLFDKDPWAASNHILQPIINLAAAGEISKARENLTPVIKTISQDHPAINLTQAWITFYESVWPPPDVDKLENEAQYLQWRQKHLAGGRPRLDKLPVDNDYYRKEKQRLELLYAAAAGDLKLAYQLAQEAYGRNPRDYEALAIQYWIHHKLHNSPLKKEDSIEYYRTRALLAIYFMDNRQSGLSLGELAFRETLTLAEARRLIQFCRANGWTEFLQKIQPQILKTYPLDPIISLK